MEADKPLAQVAQRERTEHQRRAELLTLVFTDIVGSSELKDALGDREGVSIIEKHHGILRGLLRRFPEAQEIETAGDSFLLAFRKPSDAVWFALVLQNRLRSWAKTSAHAVRDRIGLHIGEVFVDESEAKSKQLSGTQVDVCARVMSLAEGDQILMTRSVFDNARQALKGSEIAGLGELEWHNHGLYVLKGREEPFEICEAGEAGLAFLKAPPDTPKAHRFVAADEQQVFGWRPAVGQTVPETKWVLEHKLGEGGFGEVWLARHVVLNDRRVFKFCFDTPKVRFLKRELTLFRLLKERVGDHPNIVALREFCFDPPPCYVVMDYVDGRDLKSWWEEHGGVAIPMAARLEIVAQVADGLQAAHDAGIIHRDIKPANILIKEGRAGNAESGPKPGATSEPPTSTLSPLLSVTAKLGDFGIGQVVSEDVLQGITKAGFTQTMLLQPESSSQSGTHHFIAPELFAGKPASIRSDIYSLGVVLYQLVVGDFSRTVTMDLASEVEDSLLREDLRHCLAGHPNDRFAAAAQLARNLRTLEQRRLELMARERAAYRRGVMRAAAISAVLVAAFAGLSMFAFRKARQETAQRMQMEAQRYTLDMNLAGQALRDNNLGRAWALLQRNVPGAYQKDWRDWEWRFLWGQCQTDAIAAVQAQSDPVFSVCFSPDSKHLAVGGGEGDVQLWDAGLQSKSAEFKGQGWGSVTVFSPDGAWLAFTGQGPNQTGLIRRWHMTEAREVSPLVLSNYVSSLDFSSDGNYLAAWEWDDRNWAHSIKIWEVEGWRLARTFAASPGTTAYHGKIAFCPGRMWLASGETDGRVQLIDYRSERPPLSIQAHKEGVSALAVSPDGKWLASGAAFGDSSVRLWNLETRDLVAKLDGHSAWISALEFLPDSRTLVSASADQTLRFWDVESQQERAVLRGHRLEVWSVAVSADGRRVASGSKDSSVNLWSAEPKDHERYRKLVRAGLGTFALSTRSSMMAAADSKTGEISLWNAETLEPIHRLEPMGGGHGKVALSPDDRWLAGGHKQGTVWIWDLASNRTAALLNEAKAGVNFLQFIQDGQTLVSGHGDGTVLIWDTSKWSKSASWELEPNDRCAAISPDGRMVLSVQNAGPAKFWDLFSGAKQATWNTEKGLIAAAYSPNGASAAAVTQMGTVHIWDVIQQRAMDPPLRGHLLGVHGVAFSPNGRRLATASNTREAVKLWDLETLQEVATLSGDGTRFGNLAFSHSGDELLALSSEGTLHRWKAQETQK